MTTLLRIDDETINADTFVNLLKLSGRYESLIDEVVEEKLVVHSAKRHGIEITPDAVQKRADQIRRVSGLHRAVEMNRYLETLKVTAAEYQSYIADVLYYEKMMERVLSDEAVEKFFRLNSPQFDTIDVSHIAVNSEGKAREIMAILSDEPDRFAELAREFSIGDTGKDGGHIGRVSRGLLQGDVEAKVFAAEKGAILGPFPTPDQLCFEVFRINEKRPAVLDEETRKEIHRLLKERWLIDQAREHRLEIL